MKKTKFEVGANLLVGLRGAEIAWKRSRNGEWRRMGGHPAHAHAREAMQIADIEANYEGREAANVGYAKL